MAAKIFLTSRPGCGKTTAIRNAVALIGPVAGGFTTEEIRVKGRRVGFQVTDVHTGVEGVLAHVGRAGLPRVGKYGVDVAEFDRIGVAALRAALRRAGCVLIDEVGKMELFSEAFREAVGKALDSDHPVLGTVAKSGHPFVAALRRRKDVRIIEVTLSSRDELPARLAEMLGPERGAQGPPPSS